MALLIYPNCNLHTTKWLRIIIKWKYPFLITGPTNQHQLRPLSFGSRPFLDPGYSHLRELEYRRKGTNLGQHSSNNNNNNNNTTNNNNNNNSNNNNLLSVANANQLNSLECQGYKPNAPQIQGNSILHIPYIIYNINLSFAKYVFCFRCNSYLHIYCLFNINKCQHIRSHIQLIKQFTWIDSMLGWEHKYLLFVLPTLKR